MTRDTWSWESVHRDILRCSIQSCYRTACNSGLCDVHYVDGAHLQRRQVAVLEPEPEPQPEPQPEIPAKYEVFARSQRKRINVRRKQMGRIAEEIRRINLVGEESGPAFDTAMLLFMAFSHGQDPDRLAAVTGMDRGFVGLVVKRLIDNGCWEDGKFVFEYDISHNGFQIELALHLLVGQGIVERVPA